MDILETRPEYEKNRNYLWNTIAKQVYLSEEALNNLGYFVHEKIPPKEVLYKNQKYIFVGFQKYQKMDVLMHVYVLESHYCLLEKRIKLK